MYLISSQWLQCNQIRTLYTDRYPPLIPSGHEKPRLKSMTQILVFSPMFTHWHEVSTIFYISRARSASGCFFFMTVILRSDVWLVSLLTLLLHSCFLLQIEAICFLEKVFIFIQRTNIDNFPCCNCIQSSEQSTQHFPTRMVCFRNEKNIHLTFLAIQYIECHERPSFEFASNFSEWHYFDLFDK